MFITQEWVEMFTSKVNKTFIFKYIGNWSGKLQIFRFGSFQAQDLKDIQCISIVMYSTFNLVFMEL